MSSKSKQKTSVNPDQELQDALMEMAGRASESWLDQLLCGLLCEIVTGVCRFHGGMCREGFGACSIASVVAGTENSKRNRSEAAHKCLAKFMAQQERKKQAKRESKKQAKQGSASGSKK